MFSIVNEITSRSINKSRFLFNYFYSQIGGYLNFKEFKSIEEFCLFIGYGRSGHTLVASILNAHPEIVIGIEWGLFMYLRLGYGKKQILYSLIKNSESYSRKLKNVWTGYSYNIKDSWQGKYSTLKVIGDKHGGMNANRLLADPELIKLTEKKLGFKPKIIHSVRNPFDVITTITKRRCEKRDPSYTPETLDLLSYIELFFKHASIIKKLKEEAYYDIIDVYHEKLIDNPEEEISRLVSFFGLQADERYLENCAEIIYRNPNKSRLTIDWPDSLIAYVDNKIAEFDFLNHYNYNN